MNKALGVLRGRSLACVTHHINGSQACSRFALSLGLTERLVVIGALGGEQRRVDQSSHEVRVDDTKETANLKLGIGRKRSLQYSLHSRWRVQGSWHGVFKKKFDSKQKQSGRLKICLRPKGKVSRCVTA